MIIVKFNTRQFKAKQACTKMLFGRRRGHLGPCQSEQDLVQTWHAFASQDQLYCPCQAYLSRTTKTRMILGANQVVHLFLSSPRIARRLRL